MRRVKSLTLLAGVWSLVFAIEASGIPLLAQAVPRNDTEILPAALIAAATDEEVNRLLATPNEIKIPELSKAILKLGRDLYISGRIEQALTIYNLAQRVAERLKDRQGIANALRSIGNVSLSRGDPE